MKHQTIEQLEIVAAVDQDYPRQPMLRSERLERWAELLERHPARPIAALTGTEHRPTAIRDTMRSAGSPITVAFEDPLLRAEGLKDDTYGEAKRFFQVSDGHLHGIVCDCHVGATMEASRAARYVRIAIGGNRGFFAGLRESAFWLMR